MTILFAVNIVILTVAGIYTAVSWYSRKKGAYGYSKVSYSGNGERVQGRGQAAGKWLLIRQRVKERKDPWELPLKQSPRFGSNWKTAQLHLTVF